MCVCEVRDMMLTELLALVVDAIVKVDNSGFGPDDGILIDIVREEAGYSVHLHN